MPVVQEGTTRAAGPHDQADDRTEYNALRLGAPDEDDRRSADEGDASLSTLCRPRSVIGGDCDSLDTARNRRLTDMDACVGRSSWTHDKRPIDPYQIGLVCIVYSKITPIPTSGCEAFCLRATIHFDH
jgi:hypothetical protein